MACLAMHLAIAEEYLKKNVFENHEAFIRGAFLPDIAEDKVQSHYGIKMPIKRVKDMLDSKVDIVNCAQSVNLADDLDRAVFLHLITDYLFYNFVYNVGLEEKSPDQIKAMMYQDYDFVTNHVMKNYKITIPEKIKHIVKSKDGKIDSTFFNNEEIDKFIKLISQLNLEESKQKILQNSNAFKNEFLNKVGKVDCKEKP